MAATPEAPVGAPDIVPAPSRAEGSAGGGPSTDRETMVTPRRMIRPRVRFSSEVVGATFGALEMNQFRKPWLGKRGLMHDLVGFLFMRRNSSVSERTIFICYPLLVPAGKPVVRGGEPCQTP